MGEPIQARHPTEGLAEEVRAGLTAPSKSLPCRFLYDDEGSRLFEEICALPEYYVLRAEHEILSACASELANLMPSRLHVFELGSGSAFKTRLLLEALLDAHQVTYVPVDISATALEQSTQALAVALPGLSFQPIHGEYEAGLRWLEAAEGPKLLLWLGSNIGNLHRNDAGAFLRRVSKAMSFEDRLLLGVDLRKPASVLEPAYDDAEGVTAAFNKNLLTRINRELGGHFDLSTFRHMARYDEQLGRVEMRLVSNRAQRVRIDALGLDISFDDGEAIHTESSYKYSADELQAVTEAAGLKIERQWKDRGGRFSDLLLKRADTK